MTTVKTWIASAALVGGTGGGVVAGLATGGTGQPARAATPPPAAAPDATALQQQIDGLLREDQALKRAVARARLRLEGQVRAGERSLSALHQRIVAAQKELAQAQAARAAAVTVTVVPAPPAAASTPAAHATTGASGAGTATGDDGEPEGGSDD
jgi:hypothetical protein